MRKKTKITGNQQNSQSTMTDTFDKTATTLK